MYCILANHVRAALVQEYSPESRGQKYYRRIHLRANHESSIGSLTIEPIINWREYVFLQLLQYFRVVLLLLIVTSTDDGGGSALLDYFKCCVVAKCPLRVTASKDISRPPSFLPRILLAAGGQCSNAIMDTLLFLLSLECTNRRGHRLLVNRCGRPLMRLVFVSLARVRSIGCTY